MDAGLESDICRPTTHRGLGAKSMVWTQLLTQSRPRQLICAQGTSWLNHISILLSVALSSAHSAGYDLCGADRRVRDLRAYQFEYLKHPSIGVQEFVVRIEIPALEISESPQMIDEELGDAHVLAFNLVIAIEAGESCSAALTLFISYE